MDDATKELINYGVLGVVVIGLVWTVRFLWTHIQELRTEAKAERDASLAALKANTDVLHELKRLLETTRQKR